MVELPVCSVLSSQVGYDAQGTKRVLVRGDRADAVGEGARFLLLDEAKREVASGAVRAWGAKWNAHWWEADFSAWSEPGLYRLLLVDDGGLPVQGDPVEIRNDALWHAFSPGLVLDMLDTRAEQARTGVGWRDCGSDLQELSSHAVVLDSLCDVLEVAGDRVSEDERRRILVHLENGSDFIVSLQGRAAALGLGDGPVVHEPRQEHVVTGDVAKTAMALARVARLLAPSRPDKSAAYLARAERAFAWIEEHGPIVDENEPLFFAPVNGAPAGSVPPADQWMTRDLVMMLRAALELVKAGRGGYEGHVFSYAARILARQVPAEEAEDELYGHFYLYDDYASFGGARFTEKANVHCGAWTHEGRRYHQGGHWPHYLLALVEMGERWPDHPAAPRWRRALYDLAYGYLLPACARSPFLILPAGYWTEEGLLHFSGWYHGHNNLYAFAATLALELEQVFGDARFRAIAVGNLQWIAGLNAGLREEDAAGPGRYLPVSMIAGVGRRHRGSWTGIPGTICNGFSASPQFRIEPPRAATDLPSHFDDEGYVAHSLPYLAALARFVSHPAR